MDGLKKEDHTFLKGFCVEDFFINNFFGFVISFDSDSGALFRFSARPVKFPLCKMNMFFTKE